MIVLLGFLLAVILLAFLFLRDERVAHSTWRISSARLSGVDLADCFLRTTKRRLDAYHVGEMALTIQPPDRQWLLTLHWDDRVDGTGVAEMILEQAPEMIRLGNVDLGLAIDLIRSPWLVSDRMRRFLRQVHELDPSADVGSHRTPYV